MAHKGKRGAPAVSMHTMYAVLLAAAVYLAAAYTGFFAPNADPHFASMLVAVGTAMLAAALVRAWQEGRGEPLADERTKLVHRIAVGYSWWLSYVAVAALLLAEHFGLAKLGAEGALSLVFFTMIASLILFRLIVSRREVLE